MFYFGSFLSVQVYVLFVAGAFDVQLVVSQHKQAYMLEKKED